MRSFIDGTAAKAIVAVIGAAVILLSHYSGMWWEEPAVAALTAISVFLVPNSPSKP